MEVAKGWRGRSQSPLPAPAGAEPLLTEKQQYEQIFAKPFTKANIRAIMKTQQENMRSIMAFR